MLESIKVLHIPLHFFVHCFQPLRNKTLLKSYFPTLLDPAGGRKKPAAENNGMILNAHAHRLQSMYNVRPAGNSLPPLPVAATEHINEVEHRLVIFLNIQREREPGLNL